MDANALFVEATRQHFRFKTPAGEITVEDLWDLPLTSTVNRPNLDDLAKALHKQLKEDETVSFVRPVVKKTAELQARFDVVKTVIDYKVAERDANLAAKEKAERKQKLMEIISKKKDSELEGKSTAELEAMLNAL
jgi:hypothetical protein